MTAELQTSPVAGLGHPATAALEALGLLDGLDAAGAQVEDLSRAHPVSRVRLPDGRRWVVKGGHGAGGPDLAVECLIYRIAAWCEPVAAVMPTAIAVEEDLPLLVLADVAGVAEAGSLLQQVGTPPLFRGPDQAYPEASSRDLVDVSGQLGRMLGELHRSTAGLPLPPAPPPLALLTLGPQRLAVAGPMNAAIAALLAEPAVVTAAAELAAPVAGCLVHHDLKWDNVVVSGEPGAWRPVLLDWEMAGLGDPAWDLGCLLAEHQLRTVTGRLNRSGKALLRHYGDGAQLKTGVRAVFARRVALAAALRVAQLSVEVANMSSCAAPGTTERLAAYARRLLDALPGTVEEITRCLS